MAEIIIYCDVNAVGLSYALEKWCRNQESLTFIQMLSQMCVTLGFVCKIKLFKMPDFQNIGL